MEYPARLNYAREKFKQAVYWLAVGPGDVRSRLKIAFLEFHPVQERDIPDDLLEDFKWIKSQLTKRNPIAQEGSLVATLKTMQNRTGAKIAERICYVATMLDVYCDRQMSERE